MKSCLDLSRPACQQISSADAIPVFWYTSLRESATRIQCKTASCNFLAKTDANKAIKLVTLQEEACIFVVDPGSIQPESAGKKQFLLSDLEFWTSVGGVPGRNHIFLYPGCLSSCDGIGTRDGWGS